MQCLLSMYTVNVYSQCVQSMCTVNVQSLAEQKYQTELHKQMNIEQCIYQSQVREESVTDTLSMGSLMAY